MSTTCRGVARQLSITRRTLHRRLQPHGVSLEQLLDETRFDLARQLLRTSQSSILEIAAALGYANAPTFTRAFRRWSGSTPRGERRQTQRGEECARPD